MKLPNAQRAVVEREKIVDYLLNAAHPDNGGKASLFLAVGFTPNAWAVLASEVTETVESAHGIKYVLDGRVGASADKSAAVRTIWIVDRGLDTPRLVTAYPRKE